MVELTKDQQELVSLIRSAIYKLGPDTRTDVFGLTGFNVSGGMCVVYSLDQLGNSTSYRVTLISTTTRMPLRKLLLEYNYANKRYDYGTMPFTRGGSFDHDNSVIEVYKSDVEEGVLIKIVQSMPKSHVIAFKQALNRISLRNL